MRRQFRRLRPRAARLRAALAAPALALIAGCSSTSPPMAPGAAISMAPSAWQIRYSPGMPMQPVANAGGGWAFDFPSSAKGLCPAPATQPPDFNVSPCSHVDYVTVPYTAPITAKSLTITLDVVASSPVYDYHTAPNNTCVTTAKARLLLEHTGDASLSNVVYRKRRRPSEMDRFCPPLRASQFQGAPRYREEPNMFPLFCLRLPIIGGN
jgi:hypothetical protein